MLTTNTVYFPNTIIPPEDCNPVRYGTMKRGKRGRTVEEYGILPIFSRCDRCTEHLQAAVSNGFNHSLKRATATIRICQHVELCFYRTRGKRRPFLLMPEKGVGPQISRLRLTALIDFSMRPTLNNAATKDIL